MAIIIAGCDLVHRIWCTGYLMKTAALAAGEGQKTGLNTRPRIAILTNARKEQIPGSPHNTL